MTILPKFGRVMFCLVVLALSSRLASAADTLSADDQTFFETRVRPILVERGDVE